MTHWTQKWKLFNLYISIGDWSLNYRFHENVPPVELPANLGDTVFVGGAECLVDKIRDTYIVLHPIAISGMKIDLVRIFP